MSQSVTNSIHLVTCLRENSVMKENKEKTSSALTQWHQHPTIHTHTQKFYTIQCIFICQPTSGFYVHSINITQTNLLFFWHNLQFISGVKSPASPAFRRKMNHHSKYNLHSKKSKIFKHHEKFSLLTSLQGHLQVKDNNGGVCFVLFLFFVQTTNERSK